MVAAVAWGAGGGASGAERVATSTPNGAAMASANAFISFRSSSDGATSDRRSDVLLASVAAGRAEPAKPCNRAMSSPAHHHRHSHTSEAHGPPAGLPSTRSNVRSYLRFATDPTPVDGAGSCARQEGVVLVAHARPPAATDSSESPRPTAAGTWRTWRAAQQRALPRHPLAHRAQRWPAAHRSRRKQRQQHHRRAGHPHWHAVLLMRPRLERVR